MRLFLRVEACARPLHALELPCCFVEISSRLYTVFFSSSLFNNKVHFPPVVKIYKSSTNI